MREILPSKHEAVKNCWSDVGTPSATVGQHQTKGSEHLNFSNLNARDLSCQGKVSRTLIFLAPGKYIWAGALKAFD